MNVDITADPSTIVQAEEPYDPATPVNVTVCGPVQTREVPALAPPGYSTLIGVTSTFGVRALSMEPRRKYATLVAAQAIYIATSQAGAQSGASGGMQWPALIPYPVRHAHEVWVCAVTGPTDVGVETVNWSE